MCLLAMNTPVTIKKIKYETKKIWAIPGIDPVPLLRRLNV